MNFEGVRPKEERRRATGRVLVAILAGLSAVILAPMEGRGLFRNASQAPPSGSATAAAPVASAPAETAAAQKDERIVGTVNADRKKQLTDDSERLLKLATDLKAEVDKTSKDTLSLAVIRKANEIEKLAHNVRDKLKGAAATK